MCVCVCVFVRVCVCPYNMCVCVCFAHWSLFSDRHSLDTIKVRGRILVCVCVCVRACVYVGVCTDYGLLSNIHSILTLFELQVKIQTQEVIPGKPPQYAVCAFVTVCKYVTVCGPVTVCRYVTVCRPCESVWTCHSIKTYGRRVGTTLPDVHHHDVLTGAPWLTVIWLLHTCIHSYVGAPWLAIYYSAWL